MYVQFTSCVYKVADLRFSCLDRPEGFWDTAQKPKKKFSELLFLQVSSELLLLKQGNTCQNYFPHFLKNTKLVSDVLLMSSFIYLRFWKSNLSDKCFFKTPSVKLKII